MKYVVYTYDQQAGERHMVRAFDTKEEAEEERERLQQMFDDQMAFADAYIREEE